MKKLIQRIVIVAIFVLLGFVGYFFFRPPGVVVSGSTSELNAEQTRQLFEKFRHEVDYPLEASEVCFRLEPKNYTDGDVFGEYVSFSASEEVIEQFLIQQFGNTNAVENPSPYSTWHFGVGNYEWWQPAESETPSHYEDGRKFATVDWAKKKVFYSYVRSYSKLGAKGAAN